MMADGPGSPRARGLRPESLPDNGTVEGVVPDVSRVVTWRIVRDRRDVWTGGPLLVLRTLERERRLRPDRSHLEN